MTLLARPRIVLLGPNGQVGWELLRTLQPLGDVVAIGRPAIDLSSADSIRAAIRQAEPHLVVNAAAYTAVDKAESESELARAVNGVAPGVLGEECRRLNAALVHYSTDYVFAGDGERPWKETDPVAPPTPTAAPSWPASWRSPRAEPRISSCGSPGSTACTAPIS